MSYESVEALFADYYSSHEEGGYASSFDWSPWVPMIAAFVIDAALIAFLLLR